MAQGTMTVPAYVGQLVSALKQNLTGAEVTSEHVRGTRYRFVVVWEKFDSMDHPARQRMVWDLAEKLLGQVVVDVAMILTISPEELPQT